MTENWIRLYDAADEIFSLKPWNLFAVTDLAEIHLEGEDEPCYVSMTGMFEEDPGISVYKGQKGLVSFSNYINLVDSVPKYVTESRKNSLDLIWGPREELKKRDMDVIKSINRKYRGRDVWPLFRELRTGFERWYLTDEEVVTMAEVLEGLAEAYRELMAARKLIDMEEGGRILWQKDEVSGEWSAELLSPVQKIEAVTEGCIITDELLIRRLKRMKRNTAVLELDLPYIPIPIGGKNGRERARYPRILMLADGMKERAVDRYYLKGPVDPKDAVLSSLINYIEEEGRPPAIYVRSTEVYSIIGHLCMSIGVEVSLTTSLRGLDHCVEDMIIYMATEEELE
ncbi:MAG: hypothetical protein K5767_03680 [Clostridia bacterium]|nr:hypothetical protein [Clostridia bacterium]